MRDATVCRLIRYQETGSHQDYEEIWRDTHEFVSQKARRHFRRGSVPRVKNGLDNDVDHVAADVMHRIFCLPGRAGRGWFNPEKSGQSVDALRGWLATITFNECVNYARQFQRLGRKNVVSLAALDLNEDQSFASMIKDSRKFDIVAVETVGIVNASLAELTEDEHRLYRMTHVDGLSQRDIAMEVRVSAPTVCRRQRQLHRKLKNLLVRRGIDAEWCR